MAIVRSVFLVLVAVSLHAGLLQAAVIRGIVVENMTGYSLSRSLVTLHMIGAPSDAAVSVRTSESGGFEFINLIPGAYIVRASRRGFLPMEYGQRQWNSAGTPVIVDKDAAASLNIRLSRLGAITGTVRDENEVGIPEQDVAAYTNTEPPRFVTRGRSDDRGVYRISGLDPGSYLVRTTGNEDMEISYLPTFGRQTLRVAEARPVQVYLDDEARDADVRPIRGTLFTLSGSAAPLPDPQNFTVTVTLASDLGRRTFDGAVFRFTSLAPGSYEIYAEARENPPGHALLRRVYRIPSGTQHYQLRRAAEPDTRNAIRFSGCAWPDRRAPQGSRGRRPDPGTSALGLQSRVCSAPAAGNSRSFLRRAITRPASIPRRAARGPMAGTRFRCRAPAWLRSPSRAARARCTAS